MHPRDCPKWEYKDHKHSSAVGIRCEAILNSLRKGELQIDRDMRDTRPLHESMFVGLTPEKCPYYAGHYRGESYRCLRHHRVKVDSDPRVGAEAKRVAPDLANLSSQIIGAGLKVVEGAFRRPDEELAPSEKLNYLVMFACAVLVEFLRIHPYVNGNGHVGRLIVWLILAKFGYWPERWPLDTSPPYGQLISHYRDGNKKPLEQFVMQCVAG